MENNTNLHVFMNERTGEIKTSMVNGEPFFCLRDICRALGIKNPRDAKTRLDKEGICLVEMMVQNGYRNNGMPYAQRKRVTFINESNFYKMVFQSRKPEAKQLADWVTSEVLPSIRKTGKYELQQDSYMIEDPIERARRWADEQEEKRQIEQDKLEAERQLMLTNNYIEQNQEHIVFSKQYKAEDGWIDIGQFAKQISTDDNMSTLPDGTPMGRNNLFKWLREQNILTEKNLPRQEFVNSGWLRSVPSEDVTSSGKPKYFITYVSSKGQKGIVRRIYKKKKETI